MLVLATLIPLASCGGKDVTVFEYNGVKMTSGVFSYMLSENKSYLLAMYGMTDSADFWNQKISEDGVTIGDNFKEQIVASAKDLVVAKALAKEYGLTISDENKAAVQKIVDECIATYGSRAKWGMYLSKFGVDIDDFVQYMEDNYLVNQVAEYISSEKGPHPIDEDSLFENYKKEYSYVQHILFNYQFKHKNEEGKSVVMTDDEKALCRKAISAYKEVRPVVQFGDIYRLVSPYDNKGLASLMYVSEKKDEAVFYWWKLEHMVNQHLPRVKMAGLSPDKYYQVRELNRIDNKPLPFEGKTYSGAYLMANGLDMPYNHTVDYHKQNDYSSRVLYLKEVK